MAQVSQGTAAGYQPLSPVPRKDFCRATSCVVTSTLLLSVGVLAFFLSSDIHSDADVSDSRDRPGLPRRHRPAVEKYTRVDADKRKEEATCRVWDACLTMSLDDFEVILPESMSSVSNDVLKGCTNAGIGFRNTPLPKEVSYHDSDLLLGVFPGTRSYSLAHFTLGAGVLIDMAETILGNRNLSTDTFEYEMHTRSNKGEWTISSSDEPSLSERHEDSQPAVLVDPLVRDEEIHEARWVSEFAQNLLKGSAKLPLFLSPPRDNLKRETHCFRSIWTPPRPLNSAQERHLAHYSIFSEMGVTKTPRKSVCNNKAPLRVLILNRETTRVISNMNDVKSAIMSSLEPYFNKIDLQETTFDGKDFYDQVEAMQGTDVLIAAHGAAIANALFLRERSFLLEISPFCYNFPGFQKGNTKCFDIESSFVVSGPDFETFNSTIQKWCRQDDSCGELAQQFEELAEVADLDQVHTKISSFNDYEACSALQMNLVSNRGLKAQRLFPEPTRITERLRAWAQERC